MSYTKHNFQPDTKLAAAAINEMDNQIAANETAATAALEKATAVEAAAQRGDFDGADGAPGQDGVDGVGVPPGGTAGQVLKKKSNADYDTEWANESGGGGGGGAVASVNGKTGAVKLDAADVGALPSDTDLDDIPNGSTYSRTTAAQVAQIGTNATAISGIEGKIPSDASSVNKLMDTAAVASAIDAAKNVFWATYNVTTFAEIKAAYDAGKTVRLYSSNVPAVALGQIANFYLEKFLDTEFMKEATFRAHNGEYVLEATLTAPNAMPETWTATGYTLAKTSSPALAGTPTAPTAASGTNTKQIATTAFVRGELSDIEEVIPSAASSSNKLMDTAAVNAAIAAAVAGITGISFEVVSTLPASGDAGTIYLVAHGGSEAQNVYDEYIWLGSSWELLGTTEIDLTGYATQAWVQQQSYGNYSKPSSGIPETDLDAAVQDKLDSAAVSVDSALSASSTNPVQNKVLKRAADALLALLRHVSYIDSSAKDLYQDLYDAITQTPSPDPDDPVTAVPDIFFSNDFEIVKKDGTYYSDEYGSNTFITPFALEGKNYLTAYKSGQEYFFPIYPIPIPLGATQVTVSTSISNGEVMPGVFHWDGEKYVSDDNYGDTYPPLTGGAYTLDVIAYNDGFHCVSLCVRDVSQPDVFTYDASTWSVVFNRG